MSEGLFKKQIEEFNYNQWVRVPKVKKLLDEAKKDIFDDLLFINLSGSEAGRKLRETLVKWFGDTK